MYKKGKVEEAIKVFKKAICITPELVNLVQNTLKQKFLDKVHFITAPFEADAQLAYLCRENFVDFVISEDSDILVFGAKKCFYKMDREYDGDEFTRKRLNNVGPLKLEAIGQEKFI